jgi:hypothetical protein
MRKTLRADFFLFLLALPWVARAQIKPVPAARDGQRVTAQLNGVFSPRGFFNILVRLYSLPDLKSAQFNLRRSFVVLDFLPGAAPVTGDQIQRIERESGYRSGQVQIQRLPEDKMTEDGPGWMKIKHPDAKNGLSRWVEQNF